MHYTTFLAPSSASGRVCTKRIESNASDEAAKMLIKQTANCEKILDLPTSMEVVNAGTGTTTIISRHTSNYCGSSLAYQNHDCECVGPATSTFEAAECTFKYGYVASKADGEAFIAICGLITTLNDHFRTLRISPKYYVYDINPLASGIVVKVSSGSVSAASDEASNGGEVHALPTGADGDCAGFLAAEFPGLEQFKSDHTFEVLTSPDPGTPVLYVYRFPTQAFSILLTALQSATAALLAGSHKPSFGRAAEQRSILTPGEQGLAYSEERGNRRG